MLKMRSDKRDLYFMRLTVCQDMMKISVRARCLRLKQSKLLLPGFLEKTLNVISTMFAAVELQTAGGGYYIRKGIPAGNTIVKLVGAYR